MSILSKIRNRIGLVVGFIALALLVFIITTVIQSSTPLLGGGAPDFASVNGQDISPQAYEARVDEFVRNNPDAQKDTETMLQMRDNAFRNLVGELLLRKEYEKLGIGFSADMMASMFVGPKPHPYVQGHPAFVDSTGRYSPQVAQMRLQHLGSEEIRSQNPDYHAQITQVIADLERNIEADYLFKTYKGMIDGAMYATKNEAIRQSKENAQSASVTYLKVDLNSIPDDQAQPSESDYRDFYNKHRERFVRKTPEAVIKFAYVIKNPSAADSADAAQNLSDLKQFFQEETEPFRFAASQTDAGGVDTNYLPVPALPSFLSKRVPVLKKDTILGPELEGASYKMVRVVNVRDDSMAFYKVSHILVGMTSDSAASRARANRIRGMANAGNFAQLVADSSMDFKTKSSLGDLGWMGLQDRGPKWETALKGAAVGGIFTVEDGQGIHICLLSDKSSRSYQLAIIEKNIFASSKTNSETYNKTSSFLTAAQAAGDLDSVRKTFPDIPVSLSPELNPGSYQLMPLKGPRPAIAWGLDASKGEISHVIELENGFVVLQKVSGGEKGYRDLEEVKEQIKGEVIMRLKAQKIKEKLSGLTAGDLAAMATAYGPGATSSTAAGITFANPNAAGIGNEPFVIGKIFGMAPGSTSQPIIGDNGVYIIRLDALTDSPTPDDTVLNGMRPSIRNNKKGSIFNKVYFGLEELGNVEDYRYKSEVPKAGK